MNYRNKWAVRSARILLALISLFAGISGLYFLTMASEMPMPANTPETAMIALEGMQISGIIYFVKIVEIVVGILLLINFRPALAALLLAPVAAGILVYDVVIYYNMLQATVLAWVYAGMNGYLGYVYWDKYKAIFKK